MDETSSTSSTSSTGSGRPGPVGERGGTVVVGVDGSKASRIALRWACAEARARGGHVVALSVWHLYPLAPPDRVGASPWWFTTDPEEATRALLDEVVGEIAPDFPDVTIEREVVSGHAAEELVRRSETADTLVVGATGTGGFAGMLLGSTGGAVVEHAHCTVVLAR
ncbi:universal stress protein [Terrabacter sp. NPDC000476]|uniref:universal stress protein n=1 Tax=Terrabacter sp. NPDC000476 TaxID=3154258 RepID=UPI003330AEBF